MADTLRATPQNPYTGALARGVRSLQQLAAQYQVDPRVPLLGGTSVDELLSLPGAASLLEDVSYNGPRALIRGGNVATGGLGTYKLDPRVADLADVATMAAPVAQGTTRALVNLPRSVARAGRDFATSVSPVHVVKPKGGNWLAGSVERAIEPMRAKVMGYEPSVRLQTIDEEIEKASRAGLDPETMQLFMSQVGREQERLAPQAAMNRWLDQKLAKYIRNEMATPEDPIRALAERGITHAETAPLNTYLGDTMALRRESAGFPAEGLGQSEAAQRWEAASDYALHNAPAGARLDISSPPGAQKKMLSENPWMAKVPPETMTYGAYTDARHGLGFNHLVDELRNATDPASTLPAHLRWKYQDLDKVTVPQAVERVADINAWRAAEAARAEREGMMANLNAAPRLDSPNLNLSFVDKPGGKWVDIPDTGKDGMPVCTSIGKAGGWCTQNRWAAESYGSGPNRLTALLDSEGRPHAQVKMTYDVDENGALDSVMNMMTPEQEDAYMRFADQLDGPPEASTVLEWMQEEAPDLYADYGSILKSQASGPPDIMELKPVENSFDSTRANEYTKRDPQYKQKVTQSVLDFLNNGEWGQVRDLHHYNIVDLQRDPTMLTAYLRDITGEDSRAAQAIFNSAVEANPGAPRFMTTEQLREFVAPKTEGYATGGLVQNAGSGAIPYDSAKIDAIVNSLREEY